MTEKSPRPAFPLVISGPSGAGKTSVATWLLETDDRMVLSVSCTTRERRGSETEGVDYFYVGESEFLARRDRSEFVEWALVHGNLYGTPARFLDDRIAEGRIVLLDIDVQGAKQIRESRDDAVLVFLLPPSLGELEKRLRGRSTDSEAVIQRRLAAAVEEMRTAPLYDYLVVNHDLEQTRESVSAIVEAERGRAHRMLSLGSIRCEPILSEIGLVPGPSDVPQNLEKK